MDAEEVFNTIASLRRSGKDIEIMIHANGEYFSIDHIRIGSQGISLEAVKSS